MVEKNLEEQIKEFKAYHGNKTYHIIGGWTEYPGTPNEKHTPRRIEKGPIIWPRCKLCNKEMKTILKDPKRRARKFCSYNCRKEHEEIEKMRKKIGAELIFWPPQKPPIKKEQLRYTIKGEGGIQHPYKARKITRQNSESSLID